MQTVYPDGDGDGYGLLSGAVQSCTVSAGWSVVFGDCDDGNGAVNPAAVEVCGNGVDDDCDGSIDEGCPP
jgi:hypothetical protein